MRLLTMLDQPGDVARRRLLALRSHAILPLPGQESHPDEALRADLARCERDLDNPRGA